MKLQKPNILTYHELQEILRNSKKKPVVCWKCDEHQATDIHHLDSNHSDSRPENLEPLCKRCHNEIHGISDNLTMLSLMYRQYDALQNQRIGMANRIRAYKALDYTAPIASQILDELKNVEAHTLKGIAGMLKFEPVWQVYLSKIKGIGPSIGAALISEIGDPNRFNTVSALWAYCGLDVRDGIAPKKRKGKKANWNQRLRMVSVGRLVPQFVKLKGHANCFGRQLYERYKTFYTERDGETLTKLHVENRARRKVAKIFLACLWAAWRIIKGSNVPSPYCVTHLDHKHLVTPEDWAGDRWAEAPIQISLDLE